MLILQLIDELMTYDEPANHSYKQLWRVGETEYEYKFFHAYDYGIDSNTTFLVSFEIIFVTFLQSCSSGLKYQGIFLRNIWQKKNMQKSLVMF